MISAEVVDVEDEFFGEVFRGAPDDPADTRIDLERRVSTLVKEVYGKVREVPDRTCGQIH